VLATIVELWNAIVGNDVEGQRKLAIEAVPSVLDVDTRNVADQVVATVGEEEESAPVGSVAKDLGTDREHSLPQTNFATRTGVTVVDTTGLLTCNNGDVAVGEIGDRAGGGECEEKEEGDDGERELDRRDMHLATWS